MRRSQGWAGLRAPSSNACGDSSGIYRIFGRCYTWKSFRCSGAFTCADSDWNPTWISFRRLYTHKASRPSESSCADSNCSLARKLCHKFHTGRANATHEFPCGASKVMSTAWKWRSRCRIRTAFRPCEFAHAQVWTSCLWTACCSRQYCTRTSSWRCSQDRQNGLWPVPYLIPFLILCGAINYYCDVVDPTFRESPN